MFHSSAIDLMSTPSSRQSFCAMILIAEPLFLSLYFRQYHPIADSMSMSISILCPISLKNAQY